MKISERGIETIKRHEGLRLDSYQDAAGVWTIGYGHTETARPGQRITVETAERLLMQDIEQFESAVNRLVQVPLTQSQFDALVSFTFNVGIGALERSTLRWLLNNADYAGAADQLLRWNRAGGRVLAGLVARRDAERDLFLRQDDAPTGVTQPANPDGVIVDVPRLKAPFRDTVATRLLASLAYGKRPADLPDDWLNDDKLTAAIRTLQKIEGIVVDGDVGAVTWAAITEPPEQADICECCGQLIEVAHG